MLRIRLMSTENWIETGRIIVDLFKTVIPFGVLLFIFWLFRKEIKSLIKNGGLKVATPGFSLETLQKQQEKLSPKEKKEIEALNSELETAKKSEQVLRELQEYTTRDKNTFYLGFHFERTYRLIFPSQMVILNAIKNYGEMTDALTRALFTRTIWAQKFNVSYEQFMGFLMQSGLIIIDVNSDKYTLSPLGKTFLDYLEKNGISLKIPATDVVENINQ